MKKRETARHRREKRKARKARRKFKVYDASQVRVWFNDIEVTEFAECSFRVRRRRW